MDDTVFNPKEKLIDLIIFTRVIVDEDRMAPNGLLFNDQTDENKSSRTKYQKESRSPANR